MQENAHNDDHGHMIDDISEITVAIVQLLENKGDWEIKVG